MTAERYPAYPARNPDPPYRRIATEEAWLPPEMMALYVKEIAERTIDDPGFNQLWGFFAGDSDLARDQRRRMVSLGEERLGDMDASGIDISVLSLCSPGVQIFDPATATVLAREANDALAEGIAAHPDRFAGLAAFSPLDPGNAARELERGVTKLGLKGGILNGHVRGTYLDDEQYWDVFEAAEALDVPIYLHPNMPSPQMIQPFLTRALDAAVYGFACDTGLHALRLLVSGLFDRFPKLQIILGHCGEALPYWLYRVDFMHSRIAATGRHPNVKPLKRRAWDYLCDNFCYTSSGVGWAPPIRFIQDNVGMDRMMFAQDYPWQFVPGEVGALDAMDCGAEGLKMFFEDNARRVFRI
jgi:2,3-dihydroxybenzoate decarboxylase